MKSRRLVEVIIAIFVTIGGLNAQAVLIIDEYDPNPDINSTAVMGSGLLWGQTFTAEVSAPANEIQLTVAINDSLYCGRAR